MNAAFLFLAVISLIVVVTISMNLFIISKTLIDHLHVFKKQSELLEHSLEIAKHNLEISKYHQNAHLSNVHRDYELNELSRKNHEANLKRLELENQYLELKIQNSANNAEVNPQITDAVTQSQKNKRTK